MPEPFSHAGNETGTLVAGMLLDAMDEVAMAADLVALLHWAAMGIRGDGTGALVRGAMIAQQHLETLRDRLQDARDLLSGEQDAMAPAGARR